MNCVQLCNLFGLLKYKYFFFGKLLDFKEHVLAGKVLLNIWNYLNYVRDKMMNTSFVTN